MLNNNTEQLLSTLIIDNCACNFTIFDTETDLTTESGATEETTSDQTTETLGSTESGATEGTTESSETEASESTESTESAPTTSSSETESTVTEQTVSTEVTPTEESGDSEFHYYIRDHRFFNCNALNKRTIISIANYS